MQLGRRAAIQNKNITEAVDRFTKALDLVKQLQHWNDYSGALEICKQIVMINPGFVRGYQLLALTHSRLNQKKSALAAGRKALQSVPNNFTLG